MQIEQQIGLGSGSRVGRQARILHRWWKHGYRMRWEIAWKTLNARMAPYRVCEKSVACLAFGFSDGAGEPPSAYC
jgi:hypothetical protein